jgi:hypothetical protein
VASTEKNRPLRNFMQSLIEDEDSSVLTRQRFAHVCPPLYHNIAERRSKGLNGRKQEPLSKVL